MDILYVVGKGSRWKDNELLYSLRTIDKNGRNIGRVFLVGYKPAFVSDNVIHIPCGDPYDAKHKNIMRKVLYAVKHSDISNHFLISSDDHFYIRETDFDKLPVYYKRNEIIGELPKGEHSTYIKSLIETRKMLEKYGLPIYQTNPHCNTHFDVDIYRANRYLFMESLSPRMRHGGEVNCVMGNLLIQAGSKPELYIDSKLDAETTEENWHARVGDARCVSSASDINGTYLATYLIRNYPEKCKYEK